jgi:site-specific DNA-methyltransferase (adenine-specific)
MLVLGDCLTEMKNIEDDTIDLLFCDLPWSATSCRWDCVLDLPLFWKEVNRVCKLNCPMFFCCNVKFGNTLINSNPKNFRYDLVWVKSCPVGFLTAKKMPMKKHELIYVFYRKLPLYDLSLHKHKFLGEKISNRTGKDGVDNKTVWKNRSKSGKETCHSYNPPLPTSIIKTDGKENSVFGKTTHYSIDQNLRHNGGLYNPPLPTSIIKHNSKSIYGENTEHYHNTNQKNGESIYDPPLPNSILEIKSEKGKHATQKPVELIKWILKYYSKEGDTILDPTMGSGSSGVACMHMNRKYIGIEKDEDIFKVASTRIISSSNEEKKIEMK